jgi:hypothetical protein
MTAPHDVIRLSFDGRALEGELVDVEHELTMTSFALPHVEGFVATALAAARGAPVRAIECAVDDGPMLLGSLRAIAGALTGSELGTRFEVAGVELRFPPGLAKTRYRIVYVCPRCDGLGHLEAPPASADGRRHLGLRCPGCGGSGERWSRP